LSYRPTSPGSRLHIDSGAASTVGFISRGAASQTSNLAEFQNSSGAILSRIQSDGSISFKDGDTDYATLRAHASMSGNMTFTLPAGAAAAGQFLTSDTSGNLSWSAPTASVTGLTSNVTYDGSAARSIEVNRHATSNTAGNSLTVSAGGATSGATDRSGGSLVLASGTATGTGTSAIEFQTATAGAGGTADRVPSTKMTILGNGNVGVGISVPAERLSVGGTVESTTGGFKFPDGSTQTTTAKPIVCTQTGTRNGAQGYYTFTFVAADCGGTLPDTTYVGFAKTTFVCGGAITFQILDAGEAGGPGVYLYSEFGPCGSYTMSAVYTKR